MEIVKLAVGTVSGPDDDCIRVQQTDEGDFVLIGSLLAVGGEADGESINIIEGDRYASYEEAETAGIAWAEGHGVARLHVTRSDGARPLPDPTISRD